MRYHFTSTGISILKRTPIITSVGKKVGKLGPSYTAAGDVNGTDALGKFCTSSILNTELLYHPVIPLLVYTQEN